MFLFLNGLATAAAAEPAQNVVALSQLLVVAKNLINAAAEETKNNKNSNSNSNKNIKNNNKKMNGSSLKGRVSNPSSKFHNLSSPCRFIARFYGKRRFMARTLTQTVCRQVACACPGLALCHILQHCPRQALATAVQGLSLKLPKLDGKSFGDNCKYLKLIVFSINGNI